MTTVYGVTFIGAREQIEKQLKENPHVPKEAAYMASAYLAKKVMLAIGDLFSGAQAIMNWLTLSARLISKSIPEDRLEAALQPSEPPKGKGSKKSAQKGPVPSRLAKEQMTSVVWTTPLGLPVVQPYRKVKRKQIMTSLQTVYISDPNIQTSGEYMV